MNSLWGTRSKTRIQFSIIALAIAILSTTRCFGAIANFDDVPRGIYGNTFSDGNIFFSNGVGLNGPGAIFCVNDFSGDSSVVSLPEYTSPNMLTIGGYNPGNTTGAAGLIQSISFQLSAGGGPLSPATFASLEIVTFNSAPGGVIALEGLLNNSVVATDSYDVPAGPNVGAVLSVTGAFDRFELVSSGTYGGYTTAAIDTVTIDVPEPASFAGMAIFCLAGVRRSRRV